MLGAGTAGLVSAAGLSALGARVALIERNKMGGDCLNFGCVPSKALPLLRQKADYSTVPWCTYLDPEIARVGLSEEEAKKKEIAYEVIQERMSEVDRAVVENAEAGFAKILLKKGSDKILGAAVAAEHAGDLLQPFVLAMRHGLGLSKIGATIHPYPTFVEFARKAADQQNRKRLTPFARKIFARRFGQPVRAAKQ